MVTAADGADSYYTLKNNSARSEGIKEALEQDRATRNVTLCLKFDFEEKESF